MAPRFNTTLKTVQVGGKKYKQSTISSSSFNKAVKKVITKTAETQSFIGSHSQQIINDEAYVHNLWGAITQGDSAEQVTGEKIMMLNNHIRLQLTMYNNSTTVSNEAGTFRVMVIATKDKLSPSVTLLSPASLCFRGTLDNLACRGHLDLHKLDVLYDKTIAFDQPNQANTSTSKPLVIKLKHNKTKFFETDGASYFKDKQVYLLYTFTKSDPSLVVTTANLSYQWTSNFKDI